MVIDKNDYVITIPSFYRGVHQLIEEEVRRQDGISHRRSKVLAAFLHNDIMQRATESFIPESCSTTAMYRAIERLTDQGLDFNYVKKAFSDFEDHYNVDEEYFIAASEVGEHLVKKFRFVYPNKKPENVASIWYDPKGRNVVFYL